MVGKRLNRNNESDWGRYIDDYDMGAIAIMVILALVMAVSIILVAGSPYP